LATADKKAIQQMIKNWIMWVKEATRVFRKDGFKGLTKAYGWKLVAAFIAFYLIRDITLYILLPWLVARGIISIS
jgi:hypothetical protein